MSRYLITQQQVDHLQDQIGNLSRLTDIKDERMRQLEKENANYVNVSDLVKTIRKLEDEVHRLKDANRKLNSDIDKFNPKIQELEMLLEEERKLRKHSENLAKQIELKYADETLIRDLTTELCKLQRDEIEIDNKKIAELQKELKKFSEDLERIQRERHKDNRTSGDDLTNRTYRETERKRRNSTQLERASEKTYQYYRERETEDERNFKASEKKSYEGQSKLKSIVHKLHDQLLKIHEDFQRSNPSLVETSSSRRREVERRLAQITNLMEDLEVIDDMKKHLAYLKDEIDTLKHGYSALK